MGGWCAYRATGRLAELMSALLTTEVAMLVIVLVAATAFGLWRRRRDGRMRDAAGSALVVDSSVAESLVNATGAEDVGGRLTAEVLGAPLGEKATLVQFSTAFCQPCRATRRILDEVAGMVPGTVHVEIDAESHLDLVRRLDVRRTPTTLILDSRGVIAKRASGLPRKADVIAALSAVIDV